MTLDDIIIMWKADSVIDDVCLDDETTKSAKLHSKYLELFSVSKLRLKRLDTEWDKLSKEKWLYFGGKMTKEDMDERGWRYDPFEGATKPLKSDMDIYYKTDEDMVRLKAKIDYQKTIIETLEEIMNNLRWRHTYIKNIIDFKKFTSGV